MRSPIDSCMASAPADRTCQRRLPPLLLPEGNNVHWVVVEQLMGDRGIACIDGRHRDCALGAPGGDAGEVVLILSAIERHIDRELSTEQVHAALRAYVETLGQFYLHTDDAALGTLSATLSADLPEAPGAGGAASDVHAWLVCPEKRHRDPLLSLVIKPRHVGCGHLRSLIEAPNAYGLRRSLVEQTLRVYFELLWSGTAGIRFVRLEGEHREQAIVTFASTEPVQRQSWVPTLCGDASRGAFVYHASVLRHLRRCTVPAVVRALGAPVPQEVSPELLRDIDVSAEAHFATTIAQLAPGIDRYSVRFVSPVLCASSEPSV